ncbi:MAG: hypothetical protein CM1200mP27_12640 [Chloroflexota bacterium]|nr:MAG: hypothetical protein CM1200mP27_12640 [Chloroflexota bacterium]
MAVTGRSGSGRLHSQLVVRVGRPTTAQFISMEETFPDLGIMKWLRFAAIKSGLFSSHLALYHFCLLRKTWNYRSILVVCLGGTKAKGERFPQFSWTGYSGSPPAF